MTENIEVFTQNSIRIKSGNLVIYVDPFRIDGERHDADYIFVTHDHYDHFSPEDIEKVARKESVLVVPEKMFGKAKAAEKTVSRIVVVEPGRNYDLEGILFETVPAYNKLKPFHPKSAEWVGYILDLQKRIYIAGDTDATEEAKKVNCDIALVPIGGTYTMDAKKAAGLINEIKPDTAIPTHYGSVVGKPEDAKIFSENVDPSIKVVIKIKN